jgi:hypothetical protein
VRIDCDICGRPATVVRPATRSRELAHYCDYDASRSLGWGDTFHRLDESGASAAVASTELEPIPGAHAGNDRRESPMMSETRKKIVAELKEYAAKQVKADEDSSWAKLLKLSDEQIGAVSGGTVVIDGAKARASKFIRADVTFLGKLPDNFGKLGDPKYVAEMDKTKAEKAKEAETTAAPAKPVEPAKPAVKPVEAIKPAAKAPVA